MRRVCTAVVFGVALLAFPYSASAQWWGTWEPAQNCLQNSVAARG